MITTTTHPDADGGSDLVPFAPAHVLDALADDWPPVLLTAPALAAARRHAKGLPDFFHWLVLESRLTGDDPRVDLLASVADVGDARERVVAALDGMLPPQLAAAAPMLETWARRREPALDGCHVLWFEWDAPFERAAPLLLLSVEPAFWGPEDAAPATSTEQVALADAGRRAVFGAPYSPVMLQALRAAIDALPAGGRALAAADFHARGEAYSRLFAGVPHDEVLPWLAAIDWPGDRAEAAAWLRRTIAPWESAYLQIELGPHTRPYLGIEPEQTSGSRSELRERRWFLDGLVVEGRTTAERVAAVLAWTGPCERPALPGLRAERSVHMKVVLQPGRAAEVKAYLGVHLLRR